jgi:hypothetical protein
MTRDLSQSPPPRHGGRGSLLSVRALSLLAGAAGMAATAFVAALVPPPAHALAQENAASVAIPAVGGTIQTVRFYEAVPPVPARPERSYASRFNRNSARYIYTDITVRHEAPGEDGVEFEVLCTYHRPSGEVMGESVVRFRPQSDWEHTGSSNGLGSARTGVWTPGFHRVVCSHEGTPVAEAGFEIFEAPPAIPLVDGHFRSLRFYEWGDEIPPAADREYAVSFEAATARRIGLEFGLRFDPPGRLVMIPVLCRVVGPDGSVVREQDQQVRVEPGWNGVLGGMTMGAVEPGSWQPGRYSATCHHGETLLGDARFDVR